ncbi:MULTISPECIES: WXG100 family type VII secretion target [unclassified Crossiella]|uniref:WXG100 family type VII secretion target n=1 Tax=unclassified Crossiella TaxID=2620835 RepID=UPI00207C9B4D|nr:MULTISPECIES: WXG100 family type VII secretion target [unclassified Crossiella]MCO1582611.1 WXG100 family type VII secretion target [Crossiella sp. SN42]WHT16858.1 WXG100 family type VII secretion target [Crossiella sp. CA-258035]
MTSPQTQVSTPGMQKAAGDFEAALSTSLSQLSKMQTEIGSIRSAWEGAASSKYQTALDSWCQHFSNIARQLDTMHETLIGNKNTYEVGEAYNEQMAGNPFGGQNLGI